VVAYGVGDYIHSYIADMPKQWDEYGVLGIATDFGAAGVSTWHDTKHLGSDVGHLASSAWHGANVLDARSWRCRMGLFDGPASKLAARTSLLLPASPGDALTDAVRQYDPSVRSRGGRLIFANGVLLFGPVAVTPKLEQQAGLPPGMAVAYYTGVAGQSHRGRRSHEATQADADLLVAALADRLGGVVRWAGPPPDPDVTLAVWGAQAVPAEQVIEVVRPYDDADFKVEDQTDYSYSLYGVGTYLLVNYWSPRLYRADEVPPAFGELPPGPLHHWDLTIGRNRKTAVEDRVVRARHAALALASRCGGVALDEYGFPLSR
jgi:hypothetical protein